MWQIVWGGFLCLTYTLSFPFENWSWCIFGSLENWRKLCSMLIRILYIIKIIQYQLSGLMIDWLRSYTVLAIFQPFYVGKVFEQCLVVSVWVFPTTPNYLAAELLIEVLRRFGHISAISRQLTNWNMFGTKLRTVKALYCCIPVRSQM